MKRLLLFIAGSVPLLLLLITGLPLQADTLDVGDAGTYNRFPFGFDSRQPTNYQSGADYQQLYSAQDFTGSPLLIASLSFATSSSNSNVVAASYSLDVHLGVAATAADSPSTTFADNRGASYQDVYSGNYSFVPQKNDTFDFVLNLTNPYLYDPAAGDLLFDVKLTARPVFAGTVLNFDGDLSDTDSRVYNAASGATTGFTNAFTLYTEFTYTPENSNPEPAPEPATAGLLAAAVWALWAARRGSG